MRLHGKIGGCLAGIHSAISPTSDASTHYVREPVLRTGQDQIPEYQAILKLVDLARLEPTTISLWERVSAIELQVQNEWVRWIQTTKSGASIMNRTRNLFFTKELHCQLCYWGVELQMGLELITCSIPRNCTTSCAIAALKLVGGEWVEHS